MIQRNLLNSYMTKNLQLHTKMYHYREKDIEPCQSQSFLMFGHSCRRKDPNYYHNFLHLLMILSFKKHGEKPGLVKVFITSRQRLWLSLHYQRKHQSFSWALANIPGCNIQTCTKAIQANVNCLCWLQWMYGTPYYCSYNESCNW